MNKIFTLKPYWYNDTWVFDDEEFGLNREPFVEGADEVISRLVEHIPNAKQGFRLIFSDAPLPGYQIKGVKTGEGNGGTFYHCEEFGMDGWLCPSLLFYYSNPPQELYAKAEPP